MTNFWQRLTLSSILSVIFCFVIYLSDDPYFQPLFVVLLAIVICGALWEYYQIARANGSQPLGSIGILGSLCYLGLLYLSLGYPMLAEWPFICLGLFFFCAFLSYFFAGISPLENLAVTVFGVIYLTVPLSAMMLINIDFGRYWMLYLLLVTKLTDVGAYFIGKQWGRLKLAPTISPKKTWEGAFGGFILGTLTSYAMHKISLSLFGHPLFASSLQSLWFGALVSIVAQIGDLSESLLKRDGGVKDSNRLPGLGGLLDMVDSLVFTTPLLYFFLKVFSVK
jgi:phosphatidate cytidylyltransferase